MVTVQLLERTSPKTISGDELAALLEDPALTLIDVRPLSAYNGWRLRGERRGGHIAGAVSFPHAWLESVDELEIRRILLEKGVGPGRNIVVYGYGWDDALLLTEYLERLGHQSVHTFDGGWLEWIESDLPVESLPNYDKLVHTDWLKAVVDGSWHMPQAKRDPRREFVEAHIPGAVYLDTNWLENPVDWNRRTPEELEAALRTLGVTRDTTVVVYGRDTEGHANEKWPGRRAGQIAATRALMILRYAGVDDVRLLDGGYDWWVRAGYPLDTTGHQPVPVDAFGVEIPLRPEVIVDIDEAKEILADPEGAALVSVRTWREHIGQVSGYNYIGPAGRIAGDVWGNCGSDAYHMQHYRNVDNTMRAYPEIAANWADAGITRDKWVAFYCGTGWRASETWFYAYLMDWPRIAVYDGGWFEWSKDPLNNPIEVGESRDELSA
jgi:thiosulfate/3-mercaptopyruvate sulfurtransferase